MTRVITTAGELIGLPEYQEAETGKTARFGISVTTKHREGDEWIDDPPVVYEVVVADKDGLEVAASLGRGDRVLVSGVLRSDVTPAVIEAETIGISVRFHGRG